MCIYSVVSVNLNVITKKLFNPAKALIQLTPVLPVTACFSKNCKVAAKYKASQW
jgi:hypothetical protein